MKMTLRKLLVTLLCVSVMLSNALQVQAVTVTYGSGQKFTVQDDLFTDFKGVMPGDRLTQKITVKNSAANDVDVNIYIRALGAEEGSEDFLSQMTLTVVYNGKTQIFNGPASQTAQLKDWICLGTFKSSGSAELEVTLEVPIEMDSTYQGAVGTLQWEFKAEEVPVPTEKPTEDTDSTEDPGSTEDTDGTEDSGSTESTGGSDDSTGSGGAGNSKPSNPTVPATGDDSAPVLMMTLLVGSVLTLALLLRRKNLFLAE